MLCIELTGRGHSSCGHMDKNATAVLQRVMKRESRHAELGLDGSKK